MHLAAVVSDFIWLLEINTLATVQDYVVILNVLGYFQIRSEQKQKKKHVDPLTQPIQLCGQG